MKINSGKDGDKSKLTRIKDWTSKKVGFGKHSVESAPKEKSSFTSHIDIIQYASNYLTAKDLLSCRQVCQDAVNIANFSSNTGMSIFQERCCVSFGTKELFLPTSTEKAKKMKPELPRSFPEDMEVRFKLESDACLRSLCTYLINVQTFNVDKDLLKRLQVIDLASINCATLENQLFVENIFNLKENPFTNLQRIEMCSVSSLTQPEQLAAAFGQNSFPLSGTVTVSGIPTLKVLNCNNLGSKRLGFKDGFYDICNLDNLKSLSFKKIEFGITIRLTNLPKLEWISIENLDIDYFTISLKELPSLNSLIINGKKVEIDRSQDIMLLSRS